MKRSFFAVGGETGALIRSMDWSATPLGPRDAWPESLRSLVAVILASSFPMAILWGSDLVYIYNGAYRVIAGEKHPDAMGKSIRDVWPETWEFNKAVLERVMTRGETDHLEDQLYRTARHGSMEDGYFTLSYSPIHSGAGQVAGTLVVLLETTQRKRMEEALRQSEERFRSVLENTRDTIVRVNLLARRYEYISPSVEALVGYSPDDFSGMDIKTALAMIHPDDLPVLRSAYARSEETGKAEAEYRQRTRNGDYIWLSNRISVDKDGSGRPLYEPAAFATSRTARNPRKHCAFLRKNSPRPSPRIQPPLSCHV